MCTSVACATPTRLNRSWTTARAAKAKRATHLLPEWVLQPSHGGDGATGRGGLLRRWRQAPCGVLRQPVRLGGVRVAGRALCS